MKEYEAFDAAFRLLKSDCKEISEDEAKRLYGRALPRFLIENLHKELLKRVDTPLVYLKQMVGGSPDVSKAWLEGLLGTHLGRATQKNSGVMLQCQTAAQQSQILSLNGRFLSDGSTLQIEMHDPSLSLEEMRTICRRTLQPRESADELKSSIAPPPAQ